MKNNNNLLDNFEEWKKSNTIKVNSGEQTYYKVKSQVKYLTHSEVFSLYIKSLPQVTSEGVETFKKQTQFSEGDWKFEDWNINSIESTEKFGYYIAELYGSEETINWKDANGRLISCAPLMFYTIVLQANKEGDEKFFDIIEKVLGKRLSYWSEEFCNLVCEAKQFFKDGQKS